MWDSSPPGIAHGLYRNLFLNMDSSFNSYLDGSDCDKYKYPCNKITESEECVVFQQLDMFPQCFSVMEDIRRQGKLCDVTLKVISLITFTFFSNK